MIELTDKARKMLDEASEILRSVEGARLQYFMTALSLYWAQPVTDLFEQFIFPGSQSVDDAALSALNCVKNAKKYADSQPERPCPEKYKGQIRGELSFWENLVSWLEYRFNLLEHHMEKRT